MLYEYYKIVLFNTSIIKFNRKLIMMFIITLVFYYLRINVLVYIKFILLDQM